MSFFNGDENAATRRADFSAAGQHSFHRRAIVAYIDNPGGKGKRPIRRRWPKQLDRVFRGDRAGRMVRASSFHQMIGRRPVAMTIKQCADYPAIQYARKCLEFFLRLPFGHDFAIIGKTADPQPFGIRRSTTPA